MGFSVLTLGLQFVYSPVCLSIVWTPTRNAMFMHQKRSEHSTSSVRWS